MVKLKELEKKMGEPGIWDDPDRANKVVTELKQNKAVVDSLDGVITAIDEAKLMWDMAEEEDDADARAEVDGQLDKIAKMVDRVETASLLSGKHDHGGAYLTIYSGDGGTEANDWAEMMFRMYLYYCESQGWKIEEMDKHTGEEVGLKDVTIRVTGPYAYGYLSCERGTHRLARVSPFNAQGKRQTSFASVEVVPDIEESAIKVDEKDLDIEFFARSSGPGGQNVNKLATACRIVHQPTGITVVCSNERKQMQNKKQALAILQGKLEALEEQKREAERLAQTGGKLEMGWGTQIRSYVFYDNRVKDTRTNYEVGNPQSVLDGDLQGFIDAELRRRAKKSS